MISFASLHDFCICSVFLLWCNTRPMPITTYTFTVFSVERGNYLHKKCSPLHNIIVWFRTFIASINIFPRIEIMKWCWKSVTKTNLYYLRRMLILYWHCIGLVALNTKCSRLSIFIFQTWPREPVKKKSGKFQWGSVLTIKKLFKIAFNAISIHFRPRLFN